MLEIEGEPQGQADTINEGQLFTDSTISPSTTTPLHISEDLHVDLPTPVSRYTDKYFLRTKQILAEEGLNPTVRAQVFIRKGPGIVGGIQEALTIINQCSDFFKNGGKAYALKDGDSYDAKETVIVLEGKLQDFVDLETLYLGVIARATTAVNGGPAHVDLQSVEDRMKKVVIAADGIDVSYFGARHWHWEEDEAIGAAAARGGAIGASTDAGAASLGRLGMGTIPHVLENAYAYRCGKDNAVVAATLAFDRVIDPAVPRIALIDYNNREIDDSIAVARALKGHLHAVRVDTCGENVMQDGLGSFEADGVSAWKAKGFPLISATHPDAKFWVGNGVTITGVYALRKALNEAGFTDVKIILTSGFGNPNKVDAFRRAQEILGVTLFDGLGVGELFESRTTTMDIVSVLDDDGAWQPLSKVGRGYNPNPELTEVIFDNQGVSHDVN